MPKDFIPSENSSNVFTLAIIRIQFFIYILNFYSRFLTIVKKPDFFKTGLKIVDITYISIIIGGLDISYSSFKFEAFMNVIPFITSIP